MPCRYMHYEKSTYIACAENWGKSAILIIVSVRSVYTGRMHTYSKAINKAASFVHMHARPHDT